MATTNNTLYSFICNEYTRVKTLYDFINLIKEETVKQINAQLPEGSIPYSYNDFFIEVANTGSEVTTDGYYSSGYTESSYYNVFSLNTGITVSANVYINGVNQFTVEIINS